jgi:AraC-like DNA-binding protein
MTSRDKSMIRGRTDAASAPGAAYRGTVAASFPRALLELATQKGAPRDELLAHSAIAAEDLRDPDNRIPFAKYVTLMKAAKELTGDAALALHFGEAYDTADISIIGLIGRASETMDECLAQINRFQRLGADLEGDPMERFVVEREPHQLWLIDTRKPLPDFPELTEAFFARMVCGVRRVTPVPLAKEVHVTYPAPPYVDEYERIFRVPVTFESERNALLLDNVWLTFKNPLASRFAFGVYSERAEEMLQKLESSNTVRGRVERMLMPVLHKGDANMELVADRMGLTRQTLFRKLKAEGVTFEKVLDELRHRLALDYLGGKKASVNETAYLVGFSDPAAFSRAFKRWTGKSPRDMRT